LNFTSEACDKGGDAAGVLRRHRFIQAVLTSGTSKLLALAVQLLALPLALRILGTDRYASFLALQSFVGWTGVFGLGLVPTLPKFISDARIKHDAARERDVFISAIAVMFAVSLFVFLGFVLLGFLFDPGMLVSASRTGGGELRAAYFIGAAIGTLTLFASLDPAIRAGGQELHYSNICSVVGNILVLGGMFYFARQGGTLSLFFILLNLPIAALLIADMAVIALQRPHLRCGPVRFVQTARALIPHSSNALVIQMAFTMMLYLPTFAMAHLSSTHETSIYGSVALELFFALACMNLILQPLTAAVVNAHSHGDKPWVRRAYNRGLLLILAISAVTILAGAALGPYLLRLWLGPSIRISGFTGGISGAFFAGLCFLQMHFFILSAINGLRGVGKTYLLIGAGGLSLGSTLCIWYGAQGMFLGLVIAIFLVGWQLPMAVERELNMAPT